jgi:tetratricopeptide (TPR) repeat protein
MAVMLLSLSLAVHAGQEQSDSLQAMLDQSKTDPERIRAHIRIANAQTTQNYSKALEHAILAVRLSEQTGDYAAMIESYKLAGGISMYKGLFDLAVNFFIRHYDLAKKAGDETEAGMAYFNQGSVYLMMEDFGKAGKYFDDAYVMLQADHHKKEKPIPETISITYWMNMAIIHWNQGHIQRGDSMLTRCLLMVKDKPGMENKLMSIHHIRALLYLKSKRPEDALSELTLSRALALRMKNLPGIAATFITSGEAFEMTGDLVSAKRSYTEGLLYAEQYNGLADQIINAEKLYRLYRKSGPSDSMVKYFELFTKLQQKSKSQQAKEELMRTELMRSYNGMVEDWERQHNAAKRQNLFLSITLLLASIAALLAFIRYRQRNRTMKFETVRRDLKERMAKLEQRRFQAELNHRAAEVEYSRSELNKQQLLVGLVDGLDPAKPNTNSKDKGKAEFVGGSTSERKAKAWEEFEYRFQLLHSGFYDRLNQRFPGLTINERRLCAFLKLDMTTKEISDITGQSVRAVNMARIRLRNKLGLTNTDTELFAFLSAL